MALALSMVSGQLPGGVTARTAAAATVQSDAVASAVAYPQPAPTTVAAPAARAAALLAYGALPMSFEANVGQALAGDYLSRGAGYVVQTAPTGATLQLRRAVTYLTDVDSLIAGAERLSAYATVEMRLVGADRTAQAFAEAPLPGRLNYFIGNDSTKWRTDVQTFSKVRYAAAWPGIDLVYYGDGRRLEFDFVMAAGADPAAIALTFDGASAIEVDANGDVALHVDGGSLTLRSPSVYQVVDGERHRVAARYVLEGNVVGVHLAAYDPSQPVIVDPVLVWSTLLGSPTQADYGFDVKVDAGGNAYVAGQANVGFPTTAGAYKGFLGEVAAQPDAFVTKLDPTGSTLVYSTYIGGIGFDFAGAIAIDGAGNAYITGHTVSTDFPTTTGAYQTAAGGGGDAYVTKLNATGSALVYSTYLGGASLDRAWAIAVGADGTAYVTGMTTSATFPVTVVGSAYGGGTSDAFVTAINPTGTGAAYSRYLGGSGPPPTEPAVNPRLGDYGKGIVVDPAGNAYVTGVTDSVDFPTTGGAVSPAHRSVPGGDGSGYADAFVTRLDPTGAILQSTFLGGGRIDLGDGIALDGAGNVYVVGGTASFDLPNTGGFLTSYGFGGDAFMTKLNGSLSAVAYSTYIGGADGAHDDGLSIAATSSGLAWVYGITTSSSFPTKNAIQPSYAGGQDAFVMQIDTAQTGPASLLFSTYLGGSGAEDTSGHITLGPTGDAFVAGTTSSTNFPTTTGSFDTSFGAPTDAFVARISTAPTIQLGHVAPSQLNPPAGNNCGGCTLFQGQTDPASPMYAAPTDGIITSWSVQGPSDGCSTCVVRLRIFRQPAAGVFLTVAESTDQTVAAGLNTFAAHIPVLAGDLLGIRATNGIRWYAGNTGDQITFVTGDPAPGASITALTGCTTAACWFYDSNGNGSLTNVAATLLPTGTPAIRGVVRGPFEGSLVANVTVQVRNGPFGDLEGETLTDANGAYRVPVPAGSHYVFFTPTEASGLPALVYPNKVSAADAQAVVVTNADVTGINVTLPRGYPLSGRVLNAAGRSQAGVTVQVFLGDRCCYLVRETTTNSDGFYTLALASAATYRMRAAGATPNELWWEARPNTGTTTESGWLTATPFRMEITIQTCRDTATTQFFNNWNEGGVLGGGTSPSFVTPEGRNWCVTEIDTYHLATGAGATGGTVSLLGPTILGPLSAPATTATPGVTTNWTVRPASGTAVLQGSSTYTCIDSDPATWAQNAGSLGKGFCKVFGVPLDATTTPVGFSNQDFILGASGLSGIAQCGAGVLSRAKVELLSGKTVVATTTADESGGYRFPNIAPNTTFTVRYTSSDGLIVCVAGVTTGGSGSGTVVPPPSIPSLGNSTWPTAFRLNTEGAPKQDYLAVPRDAWFKVTIGPSEQIIVSLRDCAFDCSLVLYTDIAQAAAELQARSIASGQRQIAPAELSPAELSPAELSPAELSPAELSPAELSPAELSPAELSPAELSPAELSPAELSPAELSPAELSALAYSSAQTKAILAVSAHAGLSPELIVRNTWEHTGDFYMRVLSHDGTTSTQPFTISSRVLPGACVGVDLTKQLSALTASAATSIILTNSSRLTNSVANATAPAMTVAEFMTRLNRFATKNGAKVVDLATDTGIQANYANWDAHPGCALAANTVADSIHDLIGRYRALSGLKYITIAGSDRVVPFRRVPDLAGLGNESTYRVPVLDASQSQAALHSGYFLSQDYYASPSPILRGNLRIDLAQESIGRIVESLGDMTAMLNAYDGVGGVVAPKTAVSTGYDFIADLANQLTTTFQAEGVTVDTLIEAAGLKATDPSAWTADQLRAFLFGAKAYGIYAINGHFSGNRLLAADYATLIGSEELAALPANDTRYRNALILSMGCHAGYNIVDADAIPNATQPVGWVEGFNARGATVVGSTGYGYADTDFVQYSELVLSKTATALGIGNAPVAIGDALKDAKSSYLSSLAAPEGIDAKAAAEATLYGLPMMKFDVARPSSATGETPLSLNTGTSSGLQYGTPVLSYVLNPHTELSVPVAGSTTRVPLTYYDASGDIQVSPLQPVLPRNVTQLGLPTDAVLRGGALLSARYTEVSPIFPRTDAATTETRGQLPTAFASVFTPLRLFALNQVSDRSLIVLPLQYLTDGVTGTARLYDAQNLHLRLYTSTRTDASALAAAPSISNVVLTPVAGGVHVDAVIGGLAAAGLEDVLFTYTNGPTAGVGTWQSRSLRDGELTVDRRAVSGAGFSEHVSGDILTANPFDVRLFVQAVSGNAQVSVSSNIGAYFRLAPPTSATATAPKHATTLAFTAAPAASTTYGGSISATVRLSDGTTPLAGKPIAFEFGGHRVRVMTAGGGLATAHFAASFVPAVRPYALTAAFAEDQDLLGSALSADVAITRAASSLTSAAVTYSNSAMLGATLSANGRALREELVMITITQGTTVVATRPVLTDGTGRAQTDVASLPDPGTTPYAASFDYAGSDFYGPSAAALAFTSTPSVTGAGNVGGDTKTTFELEVHFTRQDGNNGDQRGNINGRPSDIEHRGNHDEDGATVQKPAYQLNGGFQFESRTVPVKLDSSSFQWLTVVGGRAELQGTGTMENSEAVWQFRLVVVDGSPDTFELSIWDRTGSLANPTYHVGPATVTGVIRVR